MGPTTKASTEVHCKGEQHRDWLHYEKVVPEYFARATPPGSTTLLGTMSCVNKTPLLRAAASAGGAWAASAMVALAHLGPDLEPSTTNDCLDAQLELPRPNSGHDCPGVLPKQVTTLPQLSRMYPIMHSTYEQPPWEFRDSRGAWSRLGGEAKHAGMRSWMHTVHASPYRTGKWFSKLKRWMDIAMQPTATKPHYRIAPAVLADRLNEANDNKWVA